MHHDGAILSQGMKSFVFDAQVDGGCVKDDAAARAACKKLANHLAGNPFQHSIHLSWFLKSFLHSVSFVAHCFKHSSH